MYVLRQISSRIQFAVVSSSGTGTAAGAPADHSVQSHMPVITADQISYERKIGSIDAPTLVPRKDSHRVPRLGTRVY
jgi:hypothetical protein